jgi:hypothetical protein
MNRNYTHKFNLHLTENNFLLSGEDEQKKYV